jgi:hypothetical protein
MSKTAGRGKLSGRSTVKGPVDVFHSRSPHTIVQEAIDYLRSLGGLNRLEHEHIALKLAVLTRPPGPGAPSKSLDAWTVWHLVKEYGIPVKAACNAVLPDGAPMKNVNALRRRFEGLKRNRRTADVLLWNRDLLLKPLAKLRADAKKREK